MRGRFLELIGEDKGVLYSIASHHVHSSKELNGDGENGRGTFRGGKRVGIACPFVCKWPDMIL